MITFFSMPLRTLFLIEEVRSFEPGISAFIDVEINEIMTVLDGNFPFTRNMTEYLIRNAILVEQTDHFIFIGHLKHYSRIFGKENFHDVVGRRIQAER